MVTDLIDISEIPGYRLIDAYDITRLVNAINRLYQGTASVTLYTALTVELALPGIAVITPLVNSPVSVYLPPNPVAGDLVSVKDGNGMGGTSPNFITVYPDLPSMTIDGQPYARTSQNWQSLSFIFNGTQWNIY